MIGRFLIHLIAGVAVFAGGAIASSLVASGFLEGQLKIVSLKEVQLAEANLTKFAGVNYAEYPLLVLSREGGKEVARITADENGHYRVTLPSGGYVLDVKGRAPQGIRAEPRPFTILSERTTRVDMELDTGIR